MAITEEVGEGTVIRLAVDNTGWLPTYVTVLGRDKKLCRCVVGDMEVGEGARLLAGRLRQVAPQLEGQARVPSSGFGWLLNETNHRHVFEWTVAGSGKVKLTAGHERAGRVSEELEI